MSSSMGACMSNPMYMGSAMDNNALFGGANDNNSVYSSASRRPTASSIVYDGAFNETFIKCSSTDQFMDVVVHVGRDRLGKLYAGLEVVSALDGKPRGPAPLDLVYCVDTSGSMGSQLGGKLPLIEAAKQFCVSLTAQLRDDDRVALVSFDDTAVVRMEPCYVKGCNMATAVAPLSAGPGTNIAVGLERAYAVAKAMKQKDRVCRVVMLTDMSPGEVNSGKEVIRRITCEAADSFAIGVTYVGLGQSFNQELTEYVTVSSGSNYFSITSVDDFVERIQNQIASTFFPLVQEVQVTTTSKTHKVAGIFGAGKEGHFEQQDPFGWTRERAALYIDDKTAAIVESLKSSGVNSDMVGAIVDRVTANDKAKPVVLFKEKSVFPASKSDKPGYQRGGWVLIELEPVEESAAGGSVLFDLAYRKMDGTFGRVVKLVPLGPAEKDGLDDEGMQVALALKQYVTEIKDTLNDVNRYEYSSEFLKYWEEQVARHPIALTTQAENLKKLGETLANLKANKVEPPASVPTYIHASPGPTPTPTPPPPSKGMFDWLWGGK